MTAIGDLTALIAAKAARKLRQAQPIVALRLRCAGAGITVNGTTRMNRDRMWL